jgi:hypothetical protein
MKNRVIGKQSWTVRIRGQHCAICEEHPAGVYMVVRQRHVVAKDRVCLRCFEYSRAVLWDSQVESVSLPEFRQTIAKK